MSEQKKLYGYLAEFENVNELMAAARKVRDQGFTEWDCFTPFPVHGMDEAMGVKPTRIPYFTLMGGLIGCAGGFFMQYWMNAIDYPILVSGKPYFSVPAFIPITFETTVLLAALAAVGTLIAFNGFPQLYHPVFRSPKFERATTDRFFVLIEAADPNFEEDKVREFLQSLNGLSVERLEE